MEAIIYGDECCRENGLKLVSSLDFLSVSCGKPLSITNGVTTFPSKTEGNSIMFSLSYTEVMLIFFFFGKFIIGDGFALNYLQVLLVLFVS